MLRLPLIARLKSDRNTPSVPSTLTRRRLQRRTRPRVEGLEERALLATVNVDLHNIAFVVEGSNPPSSSVTIHVGDTVHWIWQDGSIKHSVTSVMGSADSFDTGLHPAPFTFDHPFNQAGTFVYYCTAHGMDLGNGTATGMFGTVTVMPSSTGSPTLQSITVQPANPTITAGSNDGFTAKGNFSDNSTQDLTSQVTWASANTAVATINSSGIATGVAPGTSTITASLNGINGSFTLTVGSSQTQGTAPQFVSEMRMTAGKGAHKKVVGFNLFFTPNNALNSGIAQDPSHYTVTQPGKKKNGPPAHVAVNMAMYNPSNNSVMLMLGKFTATKSLTATVSGLFGADGVAVPGFTTKL
jgi:plastocyanin